MITPELDIRLRPFSLTDSPEFFNYVERNREPLGRSFTWVGKITDTVSAGNLLREYTTTELDGTAIRRVITGREGKIIGHISLTGISLHETAEISYGVDQEYTGRGIATNAVIEILDHGFTEKHLRAVLLKAGFSNHASNRVAEKCGFTRAPAVEEEPGTDPYKRWVLTAEQFTAPLKAA